MTRARIGPAAGASGGRAPYAAKVKPPDFIRLDQRELATLLDTLRDPLASQIFLLILAHGLFENGEFLGGYARLMELCTPPHPERGRRRPGPSYKQVRRAIDDLVAMRLVWRNSTANENQGQLRLKVTPRKTKPRPHD